MYILLFITGMLFPPNLQPIEITLVSSCPKGGQIHLAIYDSEAGFAQKREIFSAIRDCTGGAIKLEVELPDSGSYVLAAFHDLNGNGELDTSIFGAPSEPYGFVKAPPSRWRAPTFGEIATTFTKEDNTASIMLKSWKEY